MKGFIYSGKERRLHKRHDVLWDGVLEVRFPEFHDRIEVRVVNFSLGGALLHSERITVDNRHLVITDIKPELKLKILLPEKTLELMTKIVWYGLSREEDFFEIGVSFVNFKEDADISVDELIEIIEAGK